MKVMSAKRLCPGVASIQKDEAETYKDTASGYRPALRFFSFSLFLKIACGLGGKKEEHNVSFVYYIDP